MRIWPLYPEDLESVYTDADLRGLRLNYDANVMQVDEWFGKLIDKVEDMGYMDNTMISVISDLKNGSPPLMLNT